MILVSANERAEVKDALGDLGMAVDLPFDFLIYTNRGPVAVERKYFPDDFISSVRDGRFARECAAMREKAEYRIIVCEGEGKYTHDGKLRMRNKPTAWTRAGVRNLKRSLRYVEGCDIEYSSSIVDTVEVLKELHKYFDAATHVSLRTRPKFESNWLVPIYEERFIYWVQGIGKGISIVRARTIAKIFHSPMEICAAHVDGTLTEKLISIPGIGQTIAKGFSKFWEGEL